MKKDNFCTPACDRVARNGQGAPHPLPARRHCIFYSPRIFKLAPHLKMALKPFAYSNKVWGVFGSLCTDKQLCSSWHCKSYNKIFVQHDIWMCWERCLCSGITLHSALHCNTLRMDLYIWIYNTFKDCIYSWTYKNYFHVSLVQLCK